MRRVFKKFLENLYYEKIMYWFQNFGPQNKLIWMCDFYFLFYLFIYYYTLSSGVHVQIVQDFYIGIHMPWWWLAASIALSSTLGISPDAVLSNHPTPCYFSPSPQRLRPWCVIFPSLCLCILIVQHPLMSENVWCLVFCSCVSLLRMMVSRFIHVPTKDTNLFIFMAT